MNEIIRYGGIQKIPKYNCSALSLDELSNLHRARHPFIGAFDILYGVVINIMYIPMLVFMTRSDFFKMSCFKIMSFIGIMDMLAIFVNSIITGILSIDGAVFCTYPEFIYITGMLVLGFWCCACFLALLLVINRLLDITNPELAKIMFSGSRTYIFLSLPVFYGLYFILFTNPVIFNSLHITWLFDPLIFEGRSQEYVNVPHSINNVLVVAITWILYALLYFTVGKKLKTIGFSYNRVQKFSLQILMQSSLICLINMIGSVAFVLMNLMPVPIWANIVAHKIWQFIHGAPCILYLMLNKTIRRGVLERLKLVVVRKKRPSTVIT